MLNLFQALALSSEEMAIKSGISSILWEKGATNIKVTEAGLDEVITTKTEGERVDKPRTPALAGTLDPSTAKKEIQVAGRTLVLGNLMADPAGFGAGMAELAKQTRGAHESVEDRLLALYREAGRTIQEGHADQSDTLFEGLAQSALSLESPFREGFIAGKLYAGLDSEIVRDQEGRLEEQVPNELHELMAGRFSNAWTIQQVAALLKKSTTKKAASPSPSPTSPAAMKAIPIPADLGEIARDLAEYTPEEMEALKAMSGVGMESDIIEAAIRTLIALLPFVKNPEHAAPDDKEIGLFAGVVHQLEDMLGYLLQKKDYERASLIIKTFHMPVDPAFKPRMTEALKKTTSRSAIASTITDMKQHAKDSPEYLAAYAYLSNMEREATEVLLELIADETDRSTRTHLLDILKDVGKNQIKLIGERLSDDRSDFVRNIVSILGETKGDQALAFLQKAADHKNVQIRQEVVKGLVTIGGKKAAGLLGRFLKDKETAVQSMAIRGFTEMKDISAEDAKPLTAFLKDRPINQKEQQLTLEAIRALGKVGNPAAYEILRGYDRVRWWKSRKIQLELRVAAQRARNEIKRRQVDGGPAKR